jgi:hypothetical protein
MRWCLACWLDCTTKQPLVKRRKAPQVVGPHQPLFAQQDAASLPEVVNDAAIVVDPSDVEQIADAMRLILTQPALAATHGARDGGRQSAVVCFWRQVGLYCTAACCEEVCDGCCD